MQFLKAFGLISTLAVSVTALPVAAPAYEVETSTVTVWQYAEAGSTSTVVSENLAAATVTPTASAITVTTPATAVTTSAYETAAPSATAYLPGGVEVVNNAGQPIYLWSVSQESGEMQTLDHGSQPWSHKWEINPDGGGISVKVATDPSGLSVLQFEYTWTGSEVYWDMSSINLSKDSVFVKKGFSVDTDSDSCIGISCAAGDAWCAESYQHSDDVDTHACDAETGFTLTVG
ncbi:uncharacterized protein N7459_001176 [Penicillium hispanicum]|uniref:uncharacterized protein n=1 Tax=Penicillium hispanicum TaxID=1080232 RepID=UPI0025417A0E|nr:uncharacterized protein N7459_001176 [Penicillium hispanicum]KAJ5594968.1 hypothetical protein N7459_001176 [Penicillium hispanicum]